MVTRNKLDRAIVIGAASAQSLVLGSQRRVRGVGFEPASS